jgi:transketolase N-terminal domain/subunit
MNGTNEDIFFLSNGHISPVFYSVLARSGYFPVSELATFRKLNTRLQGHPTTHEGLEGIRMASGSLGQGLSVAIGAAQAKKLNKDSNLVYVLTGDGELQEGQNWEAIMYASAKNVDNLIATVDLNGQQIDLLKALSSFCQVIIPLPLSIKGKEKRSDWISWMMDSSTKVEELLTLTPPPKASWIKINT